jgi:hypothetical protein
MSSAAGGIVVVVGVLVVDVLIVLVVLVVDVVVVGVLVVDVVGVGVVVGAGGGGGGGGGRQLDPASATTASPIDAHTRRRRAPRCDRPPDPLPNTMSSTCRSGIGTAVWNA